MFSAIKNFYSNAYKGKTRAWKVFVFGYVLMLFPYAVLFGILKSNKDAIYFLLLARLIYSYWLIIALWKCSFNSTNIIFNSLTKAMAAFVLIDCLYSATILIR